LVRREAEVSQETMTQAARNKSKLDSGRVDLEGARVELEGTRAELASTRTALESARAEIAESAGKFAAINEDLTGAQSSLHHVTEQYVRAAAERDRLESELLIERSKA